MDVALKGRDILLGNERPFIFIGGPCVIEDEETTLFAADKIKEICNRLGIRAIFKSSYDKANRSSAKSFRGVGLDAGMKILEKVRREIDIPVTSDVHTPDECNAVAEVLDILQIPAFLCRQTDLLLAAGKTGKPVNVKKGPFMAPRDMVNIIDKVAEGGSKDIMLTERGTTFGYNNIVVDMTSLHEMAKLDVPVIFDAGHTAQKPGGMGSASGGVRDYIPVLARAAVGVGVAGLFLETHQDPDKAPCDGPNMWPLDQLEDLLLRLLNIDRIVKS